MSPSNEAAAIGPITPNQSPPNPHNTSKLDALPDPLSQPPPEYWYDPKSKCLVPSIRHARIRIQLILSARAHINWTHHQPCGHTLDDATAQVAFPRERLSWGFHTRDAYPDITFAISPNRYTHPPYAVKHMAFNGLMVLGPGGQPIRAFPHLPGTISSCVRGGHIEAWMRYDNRTTLEDILARMPAPAMEWVPPMKGEGRAGKPMRVVGDLESAARQFRETVGSLDWRGGDGEELRQYILRVLPDSCKARTSTRGWPGLTSDEMLGLTVAMENDRRKKYGLAQKAVVERKKRKPKRNGIAATGSLPLRTKRRQQR
ncbi:MAG: hypothetical protein Q9210_005993 [Variospora velana]